MVIKTQKFVIIMSAGRCASTSTMNFLNTLHNFHLYGENEGFILSVLESIHKIDLLKNRDHRRKTDTFSKYLHQKYLSNAFFYDDKLQLDNIKQNLLDCIHQFFHQSYSYEYIGFKEIRWLNYDLNILNILHNLFTDIYYIHLYRNIDDQVRSFKKTFMMNKSADEIKAHINTTNNKILKYLTQKKRKYLSINISDNTDFLNNIKSFLIYDNDNSNINELFK